eukprot:GHVH01007330.1.p1 GENE.GHVH01007330.1~~GHVH01007330.1.p1  ORF type:complete len:651 (-),score=44.40 GHVH01007330.1:216-1967(-)
MMASQLTLGVGHRFRGGRGRGRGEGGRGRGRGRGDGDGDGGRGRGRGGMPYGRQACVQQSSQGHHHLLEVRTLAWDAWAMSNPKFDGILSDHDTSSVLKYTVMNTCGQVIPVAIKVIRSDGSVLYDSPSVREAHTMRMLAQKAERLGLLSVNIIKLWGSPILSSTGEVLIPMEYCNYSFRDLLSLSSMAGLPDVLESPRHYYLYIQGLLKGLNILHTLGIVHTNIRPENLMLHCNEDIIANSEASGLRIVGFGSSVSLFESNVEHSIPISPYSAPEQLFGALRVSPLIDVWAAVVVLCEVTLGVPLFSSPVDTTSTSYNINGGASYLRDQMITLLGRPSQEELIRMASTDADMPHSLNCDQLNWPSPIPYRRHDHLDQQSKDFALGDPLGRTRFQLIEDFLWGRYKSSLINETLPLALRPCDCHQCDLSSVSREELVASMIPSGAPLHEPLPYIAYRSKRRTSKTDIPHPSARTRRSSLLLSRVESDDQSLESFGSVHDHHHPDDYDFSRTDHFSQMPSPLPELNRRDQEDFYYHSFHCLFPMLLLDLITSVFTYCPQNRRGAFECLLHPYVHLVTEPHLNDF